MIVTMMRMMEVGKIRLIPVEVVALKMWIFLTDISHSGQLNITTSTLSTPVVEEESGIAKVISAVLAFVVVDLPTCHHLVQ